MERLESGHKLNLLEIVCLAKRKNYLCFRRGGSRTALTIVFVKQAKEFIHASFQALIFWYFLPAPALCGDQAKSTK